MSSDAQTVQTQTTLKLTNSTTNPNVHESINSIVNTQTNADIKAHADIKTKSEVTLLSDEPRVYHVQALSGDPRKYRLIRLANGLKAILVQNNKLTNASVNLQIKAGFYHESNAFPGLAHFLEHMIFMGSKKFPDENYFQSFVETHHGSHNGITENEITSFPLGLFRCF